MHILAGHHKEVIAKMLIANTVVDKSRFLSSEQIAEIKKKDEVI